MKLFDVFRRNTPIRDVPALAEFIDGNAAFLTQKGIYEYSRARAGHYAKVLLSEPDFLEAVETSRWQAYPLGLAMVAETTEGLLRPHAGDARRATLDTLSALVLGVFDKYQVPPQLGADRWIELRTELAQRLDRIGTHPPKPVKDIPEQLARAYFELMPIHAQLRGRDYPTTRNYLRIALINIHDELARRMDAAALAGLLRAA